MDLFFNPEKEVLHENEEYNTMGARTIIANDSKLLLKFQDYAHFGHNINIVIKLCNFMKLM